MSACTYTLVIASSKATVALLLLFIYLLCQQKVTGRDLEYTALIGKPSEITFRYAEHSLTRAAKKMGYTEQIKTMYLIG